MRRHHVIKCFETIERDLQLDYLAKAEETLQKSHKYLQELMPNDFSSPSSEEIKIVDRAEQINVEDVAWNSKNGSIFLSQMSCKENLLVRSLNVYGALAFKMYCHDIAVNVLEQSFKYKGDVNDEDEELNISLGVAYNNLGCVYISKGSFQNAKESLETALERFEIVKNSTNGNVVKENIVAVLHNLRQVHQAQRNFTADQRVRNDLFTSLQQALLSPRIIFIVKYNEACASIESRNLTKALNDFQKLKSFCEKELNQAEEVVKCISLKICLVYLLQGNSSKAAAIIDTEASTLPELIEFLDLKRKFPRDFSVTAAEALADICVHQGNQDLACKLLAYLVTICQERCGANHPTTATIMLKQGVVFSLIGKTMSSRQCLTGALEIFTRVFGAVHPDVLKCEAALVRLESRDGLQERALLHSQRVLENVEKICQVSFMEQLKEKFIGKFEHRGISIPDTDQEEHLKLESLTSEFGVEISNVLSQHQPNDLGEDTVSLPESHDCSNFPFSCCPEDVCAKLSFNFLKAGLWLFNLGKVAQSTAFLLLSCTYTKIFHNSDSYCSDVILVQVISVLCHLKVTQDHSFLKEKQLGNEFKVLRDYIESRCRQHNQHERKSLFFDEIVNLKVSLALFLRSFVEMEMFEMIDVIHGLFSKLHNHHSQKMANIALVEELRFVFFSSNIECLGRTVSQDLIFSTPLAAMCKVQNPEQRKTSTACQLVTENQNSFHKDQIPEERQPRNMYRTLVLKRDKTPSERSCRFLVYCPISNEADIAVLAQINDCSVKSIQDTLPQLILRNQNHVTTTQYFMELEPLDSLETDTSSILGDLSLLPLILSSADEGAKSGTQPLAFITTVKTCEGTVAFTFPDRATSTFLFGQLMKQIFTNMENLGEVADVEIVDGHLVLKIQRPSTGQIVIWCVDNSIKIKTQLIHATQSTVKRQVDHEEMSPCSCPIIKMFFAEEMEKCAGAFGIPFEKHVEKAWCISSLLPTGNKTLSLEGEDKLPLPASSVRMELQRSASHLALPYEENRMLSESCTQTDSLSIPTTFDLGTQTDESVSPHHLENSTAGFVTDASDTLNVNIISRQMNSKTQGADIPVKDILTEDINVDPYHGRFGDLADATTLLDESQPHESTASSGEKFSWPPYVSTKQGDSNLEKHEEGEEDKTMAYLGTLEVDGSDTFREEQRSPERVSTRPLNDGRSSFAIPLTSKADQRRPCVKLPNIERHPVKPSPIGDWRDNVVQDVTDGTFNREMVMAGKNKPRRDATDIDRYREQAKVAMQGHPSFYSSSAIAKSPFKGGYVIADDSPRHPDHGANDHVGTSSACDAINKIQRNTKTSSLGTTPFRADHESKCSDEGSLGAARSCGLKGGRKNQSVTYCSRNDTRELDEPPNWSRSGAKPKRNVQGSSDAPFSRKRADKVILPEKVGESDCFGIRPVFLARHTDDNSISMASDMWNMENTEEWYSYILSGYQRLCYYPDRSYHTPPAWPAPMPHPEGPDFFAGSQGLSPILVTAPSLNGTLANLNSNEQRSQAYNLDKQPGYPGCEPGNGVYPSSSNVSIWNLPPPPPMPSLPCDESECNHALLNNDLTNGAVESRFPQVVSTAGEILFAQTQSSTSQALGMTHLGNTGLGLPDNVINQKEIGQSAISGNPTTISQNVVSLQADVSSASPMFTRPQEQERIKRESAAVTTFTNGERTAMQPGLPNSNLHLSDDGSLAALEQRVAEACSLVERVLKEREEREKAMKERERRQREERSQREQQERAKKEREAREARQRNESGEGPSTGSEEETPSQHTAPPASSRWLCEHYQRLCRVKFPCCGKFYPCHRCHNNSDECVHDNCKAKEAFYLECSVCRHQQAINQDAHSCARCKTKFSAYFCYICKHFTGEDKYPYHCTKCGICRIHKDRSFHCDVCNVCLDKRLQGKHKCRPDSGHDECCICFEDAFSGCQILPCSHKVHRECAIAMIQNGVRSCPICRHPLYSQTGGTE